ncbi:MAG: prefoldin subunit beta [Candidatus Micrarchaeia archaeon]
MTQVSKETEQRIGEFRNLQNQLQMTLLQKQSVQAQLDEIGEASEELKKSKGAVYRSVGTLLIASTREEAEKDLAEKKELLGVRLNVLTRQEEKLRERLNELKAKIEQALGGGAAG